MLTNPRTGTVVQLWYARRPGWERVVLYHGWVGVVAAAGRGRPRNHLVEFDDGIRVVVPAGNLRRIK